MAKDYSKMNNEELIEVIKKLESRKKYGLVWDEERTKEVFELEAQNALPVLKEVKGREIKTDPDKPTHILIEGDNYHALSVLNFTHQGKIDLIYIDPPYNTGNKDFIYNDRYVDREDSYRHSKWLSFMKKRLRLAHGLLKSSGAIFISIDDNEVAQLRLLCDEIFGEENFIATIIWQKKYSPQNDAKYFSNMHDFILVYAKKKNYGSETHGWVRNMLSRSDEQNARYKNPDNDPRGEWKAADLSVKTYSKAYDYPITTPSGRVVNPPKGRSWSTSKGTFDKWNEDKRIWFGKEGNNVPAVKIFLSEVQGGVVPTTIWMRVEVGDNQEAKQEIKKILNTEIPFDTPKPTRLIKRIIELGATRDSIVLDFFSGSGTTGQAILELNSEDNGGRKFILCTNNENNICIDTCYPRLKNVMVGYKTTNGEKSGELGDNLKYFKTAFVKKTVSKDELKIRITQKCTEMLCLREGIFEEVENKKTFRIFEQSGRVMAVYYALERNGLAKLKKELDKMDGEKILYCFTLDPLGLDVADFLDWQDVSLEPIPQKILDIYNQIYDY